MSNQRFKNFLVECRIHAANAQPFQVAGRLTRIKGQVMDAAGINARHIVEAVKSGVSNYIVKPFNAATMKEKIDKIFVNKK